MKVCVLAYFVPFNVLKCISRVCSGFRTNERIARCSCELPSHHQIASPHPGFPWSDARGTRALQERVSYLRIHLPFALEPRLDSIRTNFDLSMRLLIVSVFGACTLTASTLHSRRPEHSRIMKLNVMRRSKVEKRYGEWWHGPNITGRAAGKRIEVICSSSSINRHKPSSLRNE